VSDKSSPRTLSDLEQALSQLSHSEEALNAVKTFSEELQNTKARLKVFNADAALVRSPVSSDETKELGFNTPDDEFQVLQGDVVSTESAYFMGQRITNSPKYVILTSSCDLVPKRREYAALLRVREIRENEPKVAEKLNLLLKFKRTAAMYLPALPPDPEDVTCNVVDFDGICQIRSVDLLLANRIASLSLVGWRIFASFSRMVIARANRREAEMRTALERNLFNGN
jgi:hypothetical protein